MRPDARPQARKNRRRIRWNTLRIFQGRERRRWSWIIRRSRTVNGGQAPEYFLQVGGESMLSCAMASFLPSGSQYQS
jgi:hypothetical protein